MAMYLNKVMIYGNLTRDPELKALPSGMNVASFGVATNRTWKDRDGSKKEATEFHNIVVFGKTADNVGQYMRKGSALYVEGRLQTRSWEKDGEKKYRTEVVAETVQFGPRKEGAAASTAAKSETRDEGAEIGADDIPF